jgi:hypothetical protein
VIAEIKLRAERRAGEILREQEKDKGGGAVSTGRRVKPVQTPPKLSDLGITKRISLENIGKKSGPMMGPLLP